MSHFALLVVGDDLEEQLAPFDEDLQVDLYWEEEATEPSEHWAFKHLVDQGVIKPEITLEEYYLVIKARNPDDTYRLEDGVLERETTYNPDSKWDWWVVGGRWSETLLLKDGNRVDSARVGDIDFAGMKAREIAEVNSHFDEFLAATKGIAPSPKREDDNLTLGLEDPFIEALRTAGLLPWTADVYAYFCVGEPNQREAFVAEHASNGISAFAYLVNGEWHERGSMGWFGMSTDNKDDWPSQVETFVQSLDENAVITIVDCHI